MKVIDPARIRRWRKQERYSQAQLGMLVRRSQNTIHLLETGGMKTCTEGLALALAARLGVPWEELFEAEEHDVLHRITNAPKRVSSKAPNEGPHSRKIPA
ncbi:helix-turn-helix domain-containing protein [Arthrobacter silvisoli]|uniref:helix-turn-helix domain-containing protein n=1 Tax=Arthrobacter silvisoli TaxID=2291022 RepID=UPI000E218EC6|nr:helix-turn-helix transcriptional regulator [Arthrobacter silvisoli]